MDSNCPSEQDKLKACGGRKYVLPCSWHYDIPDMEHEMFDIRTKFFGSYFKLHSSSI